MSFIVCSACTPFSPPTHRGLAYKTFATFVLLIMTDHWWPTSSVTWIFRVKMKHNACSYSLFSCFQHFCCRIAIFGQNSRTWLNMLENLAELGVIVDFYKISELSPTLSLVSRHPANRSWQRKANLILLRTAAWRTLNHHFVLGKEKSWVG